MSNTELNAAARDLLAVKAMIAELEAQAEALTDTIKGAMVEQGKEALTGDGWKASWKNVSSRRFDSKAFKAEHADLYDAYSKQTVSTRFLVSATA
ncbi:MAG: hypothetical protein IJQ81_16925 [Oscillibacter sp.]|nr:hypothetical protein [Oscillibacter sp.]